MWCEMALTSTTTTTTPPPTPKEEKTFPIPSTLRLKLPQDLLACPKVTTTALLTPVEEDSLPSVWIPSKLTETKPRVSWRKTKPAQDVCIMWVHLKASICTEWQQNSMLLTPGSQNAARVTTTTTNNLKRKPVSSLLQALVQSSEPIYYSAPKQKRPKTIHRCILQRGGAGNNKTKHPPKLNCHICQSSYDSYPKYYQHLIDSTCVRRKEQRNNLKSHDEQDKCCHKATEQMKNENVDDEVTILSDQSTPLNLSLRDKPMCVHEQCKRLIPIKMVEHAADKAELAAVNAELTRILVSLFGERKLSDMGYPERMNDILAEFLGKDKTEGENLLETCHCTPNATSNHQIPFRKTRNELEKAGKELKRLQEKMRTMKGNHLIQKYVFPAKQNLVPPPASVDVM